MHLRTKLTAGILAATVVTFVAVGMVAVPTAKRVVRDRIDARLLADRQEIVAAAERTSSAPTAGGAYAVVLLADGTSTVLATTGPRAEPDAPPNLDRVGTLPAPGEVTYASGDDGTRYRITVVDIADGRLVLGAPVDDLDELVDDLTRRLVILGAVAAAALGLASWWWIRHTTRPIEALTRRADEIAAGAPDRRVVVPTSTSELSSLVRSLDAMVASVDASLEYRARSEARLREFVADASHELRTPLTSISGYLQLDLDGAYADPDDHHRAIGRASLEADRMSRLVADLQLLAELDDVHAGPPPRQSHVDLVVLARNAVANAATFDRHRSYTFDAPTLPVTVRADADQLRQVLDNLLANIRTHTPPGTTATVTVHRHDHGPVVVTVADDGPGMPADKLAAAFDRFWRADPSRSRASGGSGLGLSIVAAIIAAHDGTVTAAQHQPRGLAIRVELPRVPPEAQRLVAVGA